MPTDTGNFHHKLKPSIDYLSSQEMSDEVRYVESLTSSSHVDRSRVQEFLENVDLLMSKVSQYRN